MSNKFKQVRHRKPLSGYGSSFVVACPPMKSNVNISMIARSASCLGVEELIITGQNKIDNHIARDFNMPIRHHRSLLPVIKKYKKAGFKVIGLEQSTNSHNIYGYEFTDEPTLLVVGNECRGIPKGDHQSPLGLWRDGNTGHHPPECKTNRRDQSYREDVERLRL